MLVKAIPTKYRGVQFRSRLEAKWAAFFDCMGWRWQYEPFDLDGWIPDFKIWGYRGALLVEVKPIDEFDKAVGDKIIKAAIASEVGHDLLLLGLGPQPKPIDPYQHDTSRIGWLGEFGDPAFSNSIYCWFGEACIGYASNRPDANEFPDVGHDMGAFHGRLFGNYDGNPLTMYQATLSSVWKEACNRVQWRGAGSRDFSIMNSIKPHISLTYARLEGGESEADCDRDLRKMLDWLTSCRRQG